MFRLIGGEFKNRPLKTPAGAGTRPTAALVRKALFDSCQSWTAGSRILDLFAGSGAIGLEALSRGAIHATFVEADKRAAAALRDNIKTLKVEPITELLLCRASEAIERLEKRGELFDFVYIDPPYSQWEELSSEAYQAVWQLSSGKLLAKGAHLFIESASSQKKTPQFPATLQLVRERRLGSTLLCEFRLDQAN